LGSLGQIRIVDNPIEGTFKFGSPRKVPSRIGRLSGHKVGLIGRNILGYGTYIGAHILSKPSTVIFPNIINVYPRKNHIIGISGLIFVKITPYKEMIVPNFQFMLLHKKTINIIPIRSLINGISLAYFS